MMNRHTAVLALCLVVLLQTPASVQRSDPGPGDVILSFLPTVLTTAPLHGSDFRCSIANVGTNAVSVMAVEFVGPSGGAAELPPADSGSCRLRSVLAPGESCSERRPLGVFSIDYYCRITVFGNTQHVRAAMRAAIDGTAAAVEAR